MGGSIAAFIAAIGLSPVAAHFWERAKLSAEFMASPVSRELSVRFVGLLMLDVDEQVVELTPPADASDSILTLDHGLSAVQAVPGLSLAYRMRAPMLRTDTGTAVNVIHASEGYFDAYGLPMASGRTFQAADFQDESTAMIVSQAFASNYFEGEQALGATLAVENPDTGDKKTYKVVGIASDSSRDAWIPYPSFPDPMASRPGAFQLGLIAASTQDIDATLSAARAYFEDAFGVGRVTVVRTEHRALLRGEQEVVSRTILVLGVTTAIASLLGVFQFAMLTTSARLRDLAVRMAVGAPAARLAREAVAGIAAPALVGAALGGTVAWRLILGYQWYLETGQPASLYLNFLPMATYPAPFIVSVLGVTALTALGALLPTLKALRLPPAEVLASPRDATQSPGMRFLGARGVSVLAAGQYMLAVVVMALGLAFFGLGKQRAPAFWLVAGSKQPPMTARVLDESHMQRIAENTTSLAHVALVDQNFWSRALVTVPEGRSFSARGAVRASPGYFDIAPLELTAGRYFTEADAPAQPRTAVISTTLARAMFGAEDPIGKTVRMQPATEMSNLEFEMEVIGTYDYAPRRTGTMTNFYDLPPSIIYPSWIQAVRVPLFSHMLALPKPGVSLASAREDAVAAARVALQGARIPGGRDVDSFFFTERIYDSDTIDPNHLALLPLIAIPVILALINLITTQLLLVTSQKGDNVIKRAIGATEAHLWTPLVLRSLAVMAIPSLLGTLLALYAANSIANIDTQLEVVSLEISTSVTPGLAATLATATVIVLASMLLVSILTPRWSAPARAA